VSGLAPNGDVIPKPIKGSTMTRAPQTKRFDFTALPVLFIVGLVLELLLIAVTKISLSAFPIESKDGTSVFAVLRTPDFRIGTVMWALYAVIYWAWPRITGRSLNRALGLTHFAIVIFTFNVRYFFELELIRTINFEAVGTSHSIAQTWPWAYLFWIASIALLATNVVLVFNLVQSLFKRPVAFHAHR
jgi:heme/copper-type cytochrome/quinol oxidase subunit 1